MSLMRFIRRHWYTLGAIVAVGVLIVVVVDWAALSVLQRVLLLNFVALLIHQFEEYGWPGGEPAILNLVLRPSDTPDRYPLNQNSAFVVNVLAAYPFFLLPVFLPGVIWLGLAQTVFWTVGQFIIHGIVTNRRLRSWYNPGLAAVVLLHVPLSIYYVYYVQSHGLVSLWDWPLAVVYGVAFVFLTLVKMTYDWLADKHSPYPFADEEMRRFDVPGKLARLQARQPARLAQ